MSRKEFSKEEIKRIAEFFRMGYYRTNKDGYFLECDKHARDIFGIPEEETNLLKHDITTLYEIPLEREPRIKKLLQTTQRPYSDTLFVSVDGKQKILFDVCWSDDRENIHGLVREMEESSLLRSVRAVERMPTGFYSVEHAENDEKHERERITQCNERFVEILGLESKANALGKSIVTLFHSPEKNKNFFKDLFEADKNGKPLLNYPFETKGINGNTVHLSIDVHLIKDSSGKVTGREGTIRDVTREIELTKEVEAAKIRLEKMTMDIDKLIHTFLHPVVKFSGNAELFSQVIDLLQKTTQSETPEITYTKDLGKIILTQLIEIKDNLPDIDKKKSHLEGQKRVKKNEQIEPLAASSLKDALKKIINMFDYGLRNERDKKSLENMIKDTALWVLEELARVDYTKQDDIRSLIKKDFIETIQGILFKHLVQGAKILKEETEVMKREVDALRAFIGLREKRKISVTKYDVGIILKENVKRFKPILLEKEVEIFLKRSGNLEAEISPNDMDRVLCNLLHNAKKYSYAGSKRFVYVKAQELQPDNVISISIVSFGIPIKKDEIDDGSIFKVGFRGELALNSDRDGTGVGLADAKEIVEAHGGKIIITSEPAKGESETEPPEYKVPYLTKVSIRIPKKAGQIEES